MCRAQGVTVTITYIIYIYIHIYILHHNHIALQSWCVAGRGRGNTGCKGYVIESLETWTMKSVDQWMTRQDASSSGPEQEGKVCVLEPQH